MHVEDYYKFSWIKTVILQPLLTTTSLHLPSKLRLGNSWVSREMPLPPREILTLTPSHEAHAGIVAKKVTTRETPAVQTPSPRLQLETALQALASGLNPSMAWPWPWPRQSTNCDNSNCSFENK
jgi:hypothetical protein